MVFFILFCFKIVNFLTITDLLPNVKGFCQPFSSCDHLYFLLKCLNGPFTKFSFVYSMSHIKVVEAQLLLLILSWEQVLEIFS